MNNNSNKPAQIAIKFANTIFVLGFLVSIFLLFFAVYNIFDPEEHASTVFYIIIILFSGILGILFGFGFKKLNNELKVNLSVFFFIVSVLVYGFETYLEFSRWGYKNEFNDYTRLAKQMGVPYDTRIKIEVLNDLIDSGIVAYPNNSPLQFIYSNGLNTDKGRIYPLGGISNHTTVYCNESGFWTIFESDEYGFNNPKGLYKTNNVDIVLIGDSIVEGACVKPNNSIGAVLRELGFNAISLGRGGNGPIIEFASLKEYVELLKPKIVLWGYYDGDIAELNVEMKSSLLQKYLNEDAFSQNLISRQDEIDSVLINYVNQKYEEEIIRESKLLIQTNPNLTIQDIVNATGLDQLIALQLIEEREQQRREIKRKKIINHTIRILKLKNFRLRINLISISQNANKSIFKDILHKSKQIISGYGGKMYFVYLPSFRSMYSTDGYVRNKESILQIVTELEIPIIDAQSTVFESHQDPLSLFPFRTANHYNAAGYQLIAEEIEKRLNVDNIIPIKSTK